MADGTLIFDTSFDSGELTDGINSLEKSFDTLTAGATAGLIKIGKESINLGMGFDAQMSKVKAISGATASEFAKLNEKSIEMGAITSFSAYESAEAMEYMAMAGWKTQDMMSGISGIMDAAASSGEELGLVADIVTDGLTAFGESADQSSRFADILASASSNANTNISMMGETFKYVGPLAGALGFSVEDVAVATGLMADSGIKAGTAGTAMRSLFTNLVKPTTQVAEVMEQLNISITNQDGSMKSLNQILREIRGSFEGLSEAQKTSYASSLAGQQGMSGLLAIVNASDESFDSLTESIANSNGVASEMADTMMDNLAGAVEEFGGGVETAGISIATILEPALRGIVSVGQSAIDLFNSLPEPIKEFVTWTGTGIVVLGGIKTAISAVSTAKTLLAIAETALSSATATSTATTVANTVSTIANAVATTGSAGAFALAGGALKTLTATMLASPLFGLVAGAMAIGGIITAVTNLTKAFKKQESLVSSLSDEYKEYETSLIGLNDELKTTKERIDELNNAKNLDLVEQEELNGLINRNAELETQIRYEERLSELKREQLETETLQLLGQADLSTFSGDTYYDKITKQIEGHRELKEELYQYEDLLASLRESENVSVETEQYLTGVITEKTLAINESEIALLGQIQTLDEYNGNLTSGSADAQAFIDTNDEMKSSILEITENQDLANISMAERNENIEVAIDYTDNYTDSLENLIKAYEDETVTGDDYVATLKAEINEIEELIKLNPELADELKSVANVYKQELSKAPEFIDNLTSATKHAVQSTEQFQDALQEQSETGQISNNTMLDLIDSGFALALQIDNETGAITVNEQAYWNLVDAQIQKQIEDLKLAKSGIESQLHAEAEAAIIASGNMMTYASAIVEVNKAMNGAEQIAGIEAQIKSLETLNRETKSPKQMRAESKSGGSRSGGGGKSSKTVKEKKEEISELLKQELAYMDKQQELGEISANDVFKKLKEITESRKLNSKEAEEIEKRLFKAKSDYFTDEAKLIDKQLKRDEINTEESYLLHKKLNDEMLDTDYLYLKDREKIEEDFYDSKQRLISDSVDIYKKSLDEQKESELDNINDMSSILKDKEYEKIEIVTNGVTETYDILSDSYINRLDLIRDEAIAYLEGTDSKVLSEMQFNDLYLDNSNERIKADLEHLSITNEEAYNRIMELREENEEIKEQQKLRRDQAKEEKEQAKLRELNSQLSTAETEDREKILKQIADLEKQIADEKQLQSENTKIAENTKEIAEKTAEIKENEKQAKENMKEYNEETENVVANISKLVDMSKEVIEIKFAGLNNNAENFIKNLTKDMEGLSIQDIVSNALSVSDDNIFGNIDFTEDATELNKNLNDAIEKNVMVNLLPAESETSEDGESSGGGLDLFNVSSAEIKGQEMIDLINGIYEKIESMTTEHSAKNVDTLMSGRNAWRNAGVTLVNAYWDGLRYVWQQVNVWIAEQIAKNSADLTNAVASYGFGLPPGWGNGVAYNSQTSVTLPTNNTQVAPQSTQETNQPLMQNNFYGLEKEETAFRIARQLDRETRGFDGT